MITATQWLREPFQKENDCPVITHNNDYLYIEGLVKMLLT